MIGLSIGGSLPQGIPSPAALLEAGRRAEAAGYDALWSGDHVMMWSPIVEPVTFLSALAAVTSRVRLGTAVYLMPLRNPTVTAKLFAGLDYLSGGRLIFGVGVGGEFAKEFEACGVPVNERGARTDEGLEIVRRLWAGPGASFEGRFHRFTDVTIEPGPVQRPHPPIWVAANNDNAIRRAARLGDTWFINPHTTMTTIQRQMDVYREELRSVGKPFPSVLPIFKEIYCAKDRAAALRIAGPHLGGKYKVYASWGQDTAMPTEENIRQPFESLLEDRFVLGSPEECYEQLRPCWEKVGATALILRTHWIGMPAAQSLDSMRLISEELLPALHKVQPAA
jgi:probable F420-dependent oxidoreductase